jgi:cytochrome c biogenesis protein CcmG/thiol:disulfide interchange protein DsbE
MSYAIVYLVSGGLIAGGLVMIYVIVRSNPYPLPRGLFQWAGVTLALLVVAAAGFLLALVLTASPGGEAPEAGVPRVGEDELNQVAADFPFRLVEEDAQVRLGDYLGGVVLVNFWATWCAPCLDELPDLNRLQQDYRDDGLTVLTLSDESREELLAFASELPLQTVNGYLDAPGALPQPFRRTLAVRPTTYVVDRGGVLRAFVYGARDYAFFERLIQPYLTPHSPAG